MNSTNLQSVCIIGRQPALGIAELESLYGADGVSVVSTQVAGLNQPASAINFSRLGGSTRLAETVAKVPGKLWKDVEKQLAKTIVELAGSLPEGKLQLGFSCYGIPITPAKLNATALTLKKIVRSRTNRSVRITPNPELELNTAQVLHNHLTGPTGLELLIIATSDGKTLIARTLAVQDIDSYTLRDRGRPKRDARVGMLPPKLAQIIIHLANNYVSLEDPSVTLADPPRASRLLDPFCGTGVLLQEAMLMGFKVYGTDLEPRMIEYSETNLEWLTSEFNLAHNFELNVGDATAYAWDTPIDVVAAETYLGRPFTEQPSAELIAQTSSEVNLILKKFLANLHDQLLPGTRLCLAVPAWNLQPIKDLRLTINENNTKEQTKNLTNVNHQSLIVNHFKHLPLIDQLGDLGYNRVKFEHVSDTDLLYYREDQVVARELLVLTRK